MIDDRGHPSHYGLNAEGVCLPGLRDERVLQHLIASLNHWRAFRTSRPVADAQGALRRHLAGLIADIQAMPSARLCLSDVPEADIRQFAAGLVGRLRRFGVAVIPLTLHVTNLKQAAPGDLVNLEVDVIAKYVERLLGEREKH